MMDIGSELDALKRLYGLLLQKGRNRTSNAASDLLDDQARLLLKNLLDAQTKRIIARTAEERAAEQSVHGAALANKPEPRKKQCRVCLRHTVKQPEPVEDESFYDAAQSPIRSVDLWDDEIDQSKTEEVDFLSKEASEAIKKIELCISAFHIGAVPSFDISQTKDSSFMTKNSIQSEFSSQWFGENTLSYQPLPIVTAEEPNHQPYLLFGQTFKLIQPTSDLIRNRGQALGSDSSTEIRDSKFPTKKADYKIYGQNVKAIIDRIESGNWIMSRDNDEPRRIHNVTNESSYRAPNWPVTFSSVPELDRPYQTLTAMEDKKPSQPHENQSNAPHKDGILKKTNYTRAPRTSLQHGETESTATDSYSNSISQQNSNSDSYSEEYSSTDQTGELQSVTSSTSTRTGASLLSDETASQYSSYTSNGEDEFLGSSTSGEEEECEETSSKSEGYSSHDQPIRRTSYLPMGSTSKRSVPSRTRKGNKKQTGMWTSLKDKLAIIFHHHHHHHHHHHNNDRTKMRKGEAISLKRHEEYGERAVEKTSKTLIRDKKQQNHHFHGLMEGLLRHIRNKKQSQPGKKTADMLTKGQRGGKKNLDKSQLWRLHRGAKSPNKTHVKLLGFDKKRARLKALPNVK